MPSPAKSPPGSSSRPSAPNPTARKLPTPLPFSDPLRVRVRIGILSVAFAITIGAGAWYGASLKANSELKKEKRKFQEVDVEEKIRVLEESKKGLVAKRDGLERKIRSLQERKE